MPLLNQFISFIKNFVFKIISLAKSIPAGVTTFFAWCSKLLEKNPILWIPVLISGFYGGYFLHWSSKVGFKLALIIVKRRFWTCVGHSLRFAREYPFIVAALSLGLSCYMLKQGYCIFVWDFYNSYFCNTVPLIEPVNLPESFNLSESSSQSTGSSTSANSTPLVINGGTTDFYSQIKFSDRIFKNGVILINEPYAVERAMLLEAANNKASVIKVQDFCVLQREINI